MGCRGVAMEHSSPIAIDYRHTFAFISSTPLFNQFTQRDMYSPFQQHFGTNYTPPREEEVQIRALVNSYQQEVRDIGSDVQRLEKQIEMLYRKQQEINDFVDKHRELISPVRMLTQDILECIFLACLPEDRNPAVDDYGAPMLLTHICSSWRRIALSTPRLWSSIHVTLPAIVLSRFATLDDLERRERFVHKIVTAQQLAVNQWLERSGVCSVSLSIHQETFVDIWHHAGNEIEGYHLAVERIQQAQRLLIKNSIIRCHERLYSLDLYVSDDIIGCLLEAGAKGELRLHKLRSSHVQCNLGSSSRMEMRPFDFNDIDAIIPSTTISATLYNIYVSHSIPGNLHWAQLTDLNLLVYDQSDNILYILRRCPQLISAKLLLDPQYTIGDSGVAGAIVLQHLTNLSISLPPVNSTLTVTTQLCLPSLQELDIGFSDYGWGHNTSVAGDIVRSLLHLTEDLRTLRLFDPGWIRSTNDLLEVLKIVPHVKHLKILSNHINHCRWGTIPFSNSTQTRPQFALNDSLLHALNPMQKGYLDIFCPQLEDLECDPKLLTSFTESALKDLLISRRTVNLSDHRIAPIRRLIVTINNYKSLDDSDSNEKISLGVDSAIYFRDREWICQRYTVDDHLFSDVYTEL